MKAVPCPNCSKLFVDQNALWQHCKFTHSTILPHPKDRIRAVRTITAAIALLAFASPAFAGNYEQPPAAPSINAPSSAAAVAGSRSQALSASTSASLARASQRLSNSNSVTVNNNTGGSGSDVDPSTLAAIGAGRSWGNGQQLPAASAYAPGFYSANPCSGPSSSLGAQFQLFGLSVGGQTMDRVCQLLELHQPAAAMEYLCDADTEVRHALARVGQPCMADKPQAVTQVNDGQTPPAPKPRPAWCTRARPTTDASRAYVQQECG